MVEFVVLNAGYVLLVTAAFTRTLGRLRMLLVAASIALITYGLLSGVWSIAVWNILTGSIHAYRLARDVLARRAVVLTEAERAIRDQHFPGTSDFDFNALWGMGRQVDHDPDSTIITTGSRPDSVAMVLSGQVAICEQDGAERLLGGGSLLGEMSYVSDRPASVDVVATCAVTVHEWDQRHLRTLDQTHPPAAKAFDRFVSRDLAAKARA